MLALNKKMLFLSMSFLLSAPITHATEKQLSPHWDDATFNVVKPAPADSDYKKEKIDDNIKKALENALNSMTKGIPREEITTGGQMKFATERWDDYIKNLNPFG